MVRRPRAKEVKDTILFTSEAESVMVESGLIVSTWVNRLHLYPSRHDFWIAFNSQPEAIHTHRFCRRLMSHGHLVAPRGERDLG